MEINGETVVSRPHARDLLVNVPDDEKVNLVVRRDGRYFKVVIDPEIHYPLARYPHTHSSARGMIIPSSFRLGYLDRIREYIEKHQAKSVLVMTSELMKPTVEQALEDVPIFPPDVTIHLEVPQHRYWGGNIVVSDLLVVDDFIDQTCKFIQRTGTRPDLIVIPGSGFNHTRAGFWKRDMVGNYYKRIENVTGIPVELVNTETIFY
jgi:hypothetical protein